MLYRLLHGSTTLRLILTTMVLLLLARGVVGAATAPAAGKQAVAELDRQRLLAAAYYENDDFRGAAAALRRCLELAPDSVTDSFNLALSLMRGSEYDEALALLDQVERLDPSVLTWLEPRS